MIAAAVKVMRITTEKIEEKISERNAACADRCGAAKPNRLATYLKQSDVAEDSD